MATTLDLGAMTTADKLQLMDELWQNLSAEVPAIDSPSWHGDVLAERERLVAAGDEVFIDWEDAKKQLRAELG